MTPSAVSSVRFWPFLVDLTFDRRQMPKGHRVAHVRLDAAGYQADVFNHCKDPGKTFAVG